MKTATGNYQTRGARRVRPNHLLKQTRYGTCCGQLGLSVGPLMGQTKIAAERIWYAVDADGVEHPIAHAVHAPLVQPAGGWGAVVSINGQDDRPLSIFGEDQWQALQLAMCFASPRLRIMSSRVGSSPWNAAANPCRRRSSSVHKRSNYVLKPTADEAVCVTHAPPRCGGLTRR